MEPSPGAGTAPRCFCEVRGAEGGGSPPEIRYNSLTGRWGDMLVAATPAGVCSLEFYDDGRREALARLAARWPDVELRPAVRPIRQIGQLLTAAGDVAVSLHLRGTDFQVQVWRALLAVPRGTTCTYGDLAVRIGLPRSARAVAGAVAANPVALLVPCHRVVCHGGSLGGYRWGPWRKLALLKAEEAVLPGGQLPGLVA